MWPFKPKQPAIPVPRLEVRFAEDFKPLLFMLEHEITLSLQVLNIAGIQNAIVKEEQTRSEISGITSRVVSKFSPEYKAILKLYFTDDGILEYITQVAAAKLVSLGIQVNLRHINGTETE